MVAYFINRFEVVFKKYTMIYGDFNIDISILKQTNAMIFKETVYDVENV